MAKAVTSGVAVPRTVVRLRRMYTAVAVYAAIFTALFLWLRAYPVAAFFGLEAAVLMCGRADASGHINGYVEATQDAAKAAAAEAERTLAAQAPCEIVINSAKDPLGGGFLYILKFSTGGVKVGQTQNLYRRICEHWRDADAYGVAITDYWVSDAHANYLANEIELIGFCDGRATRAKREYFHDIEFMDVVEFAEALAYYTNDPAVTGADR